MTNNELKLLELVRENDNPEKALITAINIIVEFLMHLEPSESKHSADSVERVGIGQA